MTDSVHPTDTGVRAALGRRSFLAGGAAAMAAAVLAACGDDDNDATTSAGQDTSTSSGTGGSSEAAGDLKVAEVAAGLEVLAVQTYQGALDAATADKLGAVPPAVATYVTTALEHHQAHLDAWNSVLSDAGRTEVSEPNAALKPTVDQMFAAAKDVAAVAELALMLEAVAAQTYLKVLPSLRGDGAIRKAGEIQVVDQQHQSILLFALGRYPVPDVFQKVEKAAV